MVVHLSLLQTSTTPATSRSNSPSTANNRCSATPPTANAAALWQHNSLALAPQTSAEADGVMLARHFSGRAASPHAEMPRYSMCLPSHPRPISGVLSMSAGCAVTQGRISPRPPSLRAPDESADSGSCRFNGLCRFPRFVPSAGYAACPVTPLPVTYSHSGSGARSKSPGQHNVPQSGST